MRDDVGSERRVTRLLALEDVDPLLELAVANREAMAPWDPVREEAYYTRRGQLRVVQDALEQRAAGQGLPLVIVDPDDGTIIGRITLSSVVRGPFQSANLGYWVGVAHQGRGLGTAAVQEAVVAAFDGLGLHRVQAATLPHNERSQRVLAHAGFEQIGLAPRYLAIAGRWADHVLFQRINDAWP